MTRFVRRRRRSVDGLSETARLLVTVVAGAVQTGALSLWAAVMLAVPTLSPPALSAGVVLLDGLVGAYALTDVGTHGDGGRVQDRDTLVLGVGATAIWVLWATITDYVGGFGGELLAGIVLAAAFVVHHTAEDDRLRGNWYFEDGLDPGTAAIALPEALSATVWVSLWTGSTVFGISTVDLGLAGVDPGVVGASVLAVGLVVGRLATVQYARV